MVIVVKAFIKILCPTLNYIMWYRGKNGILFVMMAYLIAGKVVFPWN
jgi:hypothetical protein